MTLPVDVDAVIFDCDGLLVDTETCWTRAETALFAAHGHPFGPAQKQLVIGRTLESAGVGMAEYFGTPGAGPSLAQRLYDLVATELAGGASALPGARELVLAVRDRLPVAVASNSPRPFVTAALISAGLADLFTHSLAADDVEHARPAPDLYLAACAVSSPGAPGSDQNGWRSLNFCTLPVAVRGSASTNSTRFGHLKPARCSRQWATIASGVRPSSRGDHQRGDQFAPLLVGDADDGHLDDRRDAG